MAQTVPNAGNAMPAGETTAALPNPAASPLATAQQTTTTLQSLAPLQSFANAAPGTPPPPWRTVGLMGKKKPVTEFRIVPLDGQAVLSVRTAKSYGTLVHVLPGNVPGASTTLAWSWRLDEPLVGTDLRQKAGDDAALKVCALFDLPLERLGLMERNLLRWARALSGEALPAAVLCYVWDTHLPSGTVLTNAYTARLRYVVVSAADAPLGQWVNQRRNLQQDFLRAFGKESPTVPPLVAVVVGADADNTAGTSQGYLRDLVLLEQ